MKNIKILMAFLMLSGVLTFSGCSGEDTSDADSKLFFPEFETVDLNGNIWNRTNFESYKLTMVNVWGTFCNPCVGELPDLAELYSEMPDQVNLIGIVIDISDDAGAESAKMLLKDMQVDYENLIPDDALYEFISREVTGVPTSFFVDDRGTVVDLIEGARSKEDYLDRINEILSNL